MNANFLIRDEVSPGIGTRRMVLPSRRQIRWRMYLALLLADLTAFFMAFVGAGILRNNWSHHFDWLSSACAATPIFLVAAVQLHAYTTDALTDLEKGVKATSLAVLFAIFTVLLFDYFLDGSRFRFGLFTALALALGAVGGVRVAITLLGRKLFEGWYDTELVIVDGRAIVAPERAIVINAASAGLEPDLHDPEMLDSFAKMVRGADRVVIACSRERQRNWSMMLKGANVRGEVLASEFDAVSAIGIDRINGRSTLVVATGPLSLSDRLMKRGLDVVVAGTMLIIAAPVLLLVALAIKLDSPGPVLFRQRRMGRGNALIEVYKFRSMRTDMCDQDGKVSTQHDDVRVTKVGRFIRQTSVDELPQLLNVLLGTMSLVGPRPHALGSVAERLPFWEIDDRYWHRHALKPGITGLAQVRGFRGATHSRYDLTCRLQADLEYISGWTIWRDVLILMRTALVIVHRNAY